MQKCVQIIKYKLSPTEHAINYHPGQEREHSCTSEFPFMPLPNHSSSSKVTTLLTSDMVG